MKHSKVGKAQRQNLIAGLLEEQAIKGQKEIQDYLIEHGIEATQATISRDLRDMGMVKRADGVYQLPRRAQAPSFLELKYQDHMVSIRVTPGQALLLKREMLRRFDKELFTIVADDDTLLLIIQSDVDPEAFVELLKKWE